MYLSGADPGVMDCQSSGHAPEAKASSLTVFGVHRAYMPSPLPCFGAKCQQ
jgi:hypothetical protein